MSAEKQYPPIRCEKCGAFLVDIKEPSGKITQGCGRCEPLELVDVVRQLHERRKAS